jgi:hypothetical protein
MKGTIEAELILILTEIDPKKRPTAKLIKADWLPKWSESLNP